jgi:hypothetical protein
LSWCWTSSSTIWACIARTRRERVSRACTVITWSTWNTIRSSSHPRETIEITWATRSCISWALRTVSTD